MGKAPDDRVWKLLLIGLGLLVLPVLLKFLAFEFSDDRTLERLQGIIDFVRANLNDCTPCEKWSP